MPCGTIGVVDGVPRGPPVADHAGDRDTTCRAADGRRHCRSRCRRRSRRASFARAHRRRRTVRATARRDTARPSPSPCSPDVADRVRALVGRPQLGESGAARWSKGSAVYDSIAWLSTSSADAAVTIAGIVSVFMRIDDRPATGRRARWAMPVLACIATQVEDGHAGRLAAGAGGRRDGDQRLERPRDGLGPGRSAR